MNILINNCGSQVNDITELLHKDPECRVIYLVDGVETSAINFIETVDEIDKDISKDTDLHDYLTFLLQKCEQYNIDVFIPFRRMEELVDFKEVFESQGISLVVPSNNKMFKTLNNKVATYSLLKNYIPEAIPEYYLANTKAELFGAVNKLHSEGKVAAFKYCEDISAYSFRILTFEKRTLAELDFKTVANVRRLKRTITYTDLQDMFEHMNDNDELERQMIIMEYLDGKEVSCDCLKTPYSNIVLPRIKVSGRAQQILKDEELINICEKIMDATNYDCICNIQFKYLDEKPMLLEVNTRMSGGIQIASNAVGINLPLLSVKNTLGTITKEEATKNWESVHIQNRTRYEYSQLNQE